MVSCFFLTSSSPGRAELVDSY
uniref:Uncharacterized protein n=1 Tax=Nelumbo nucifera TaxID=4432 RepID=A0A822Z3X4_NELNU|nr:TPA_asm: hypothetical protein HUJ06_013556 [Nelumbo nucifera]